MYGFSNIYGIAISRSHLGLNEINSGQPGHTLDLVKYILSDGRAAMQCGYKQVVN